MQTSQMTQEVNIGVVVNVSNLEQKQGVSEINFHL